MSNSPPSQQPHQLEHIHESAVVLEEGSPPPNQETLIHSGPPPPPPPPPKKSDLPPPPTTDPELHCPDEEEEEGEDGGEVDERPAQETPATTSSGGALHVEPPIAVSHVSARDVIAPSPPSGGSIARRRASKRKKGKGKGKPNSKKQQAIEEKLRALVENLNPIPFIPNKIPDFAKHERLLANLGLWDFVHIDLDRNIRVDLIAELIATYESKNRASYVNSCRITVSRADLARAFKLPVKKKGNAGGFDVDLENELLSDESIGFVSELVSDWLLLHEEDTWMMPNEVTDLFKLIRDGHPEKVDWATMFWIMVEKELKQGSQLRDCYYASHLQHLIKCQREHLLSAVKSDSEHDKEEDHGVIIKEGVDVDVDVNIVGEKINSLEEKDFPVEEGPSTVLSLGQDGEKEEFVKEDEKCKDSDGDEVADDELEEDERENVPGQWLLNETNEFGEHYMRRCAAKENTEEFGSFDEKKEEEEEEDVQIEEDEVEEEEDGEENENKFGLSPSHHISLDKGYTGNLLQAMEVNQMAFNPQNQLGRQSSMDDMSLFNNTGKRVLEQNETHLMNNPNEPNKKLRISNSWDHNNKHMDFGTCMEQIQHVAETAKMLYEQKARELEYANMNQQIILSELQKRDSIIEHLHKTRFEDLQKKDGEIYRLERELYLMETVLDGYRKALKESQRAFAEYREKAQLPEEPVYKDVGPGGLMLTAGEIEKIRKKQEEEFRMNCFILEQKMKEVAGDWEGRFKEYAEKVEFLENKLTGLEADAKDVIEFCGNRKTKRIEGMGAEVFEPQTEEEVVTEALLGAQSEEKMSDAADEDEQPFTPQSEEKES